MPRIAGRLPAGLLGMLAMVVALDVGVFRLDRFTVDQAESWRFKGAWARGRATEAEVLVFGDSLLEFGVLPGVIQDRVGIRAINLAMHDGSPAASFVLLRRALEAGARPRAIVVDFLPHQLARGLRDGKFARSWPGLVTPREAFDLAATAGEPDFFAATMTAKVLGCVAARHEVRAAIRSALRGEAVAVNQDVALLRRHWEANRGAQVIPERVSRPSGPIDGMFPEGWACDPTAEAYVRRFLALAGSRGIPVVWVVPPIRPDAQAWRDRRGLDVPYFAFLARMLGENERLTVVDSRGGGFGSELFADAVHLKRPGSVAFSGALADILAGPSTAGKIVPLSAARGPTSEARGVQDLDQTRAARRPRPTSRAR